MISNFVEILQAISLHLILHSRKDLALLGVKRREHGIFCKTQMVYVLRYHVKIPIAEYLNDLQIW